MNILFLSTWFPFPPDNGSKIRVYHLLRALSAQHEVSLLSFAFETADPDAAFDLQRRGVKVQTIQCNPFERSGLSSALRFFSPGPVVARARPAMVAAAERVLAQTSFQVVIASTEVMATYALQAPSVTAKVLEEHNSFSRWTKERHASAHSLVPRLHGWLSWQKARWYEARLFRRFDLCTMVSEEDCQASLRMLPGYHGPIAVVPNGVDCQHHWPQLPPVQPGQLIYNGALTYNVNYEAVQYFLAQIYPRIRQEYPAVSLIITGSWQGVELTGLALDESIRLTGYVEDIRPWVTGSAVCVAPLRQGGGTRLKILEAMASGTPVVSTSKGAEGLDAVDGKHLLLADDPVLFADRIVQLLCDPALRQRLAANARRLVEEQYDWEPIGRRFVTLVEEAAHRHQAGAHA